MMFRKRLIRSRQGNEKEHTASAQTNQSVMHCLWVALCSISSSASLKSSRARDEKPWSCASFLSDHYREDQLVVSRHGLPGRFPHFPSRSHRSWNSAPLNDQPPLQLEPSTSSGPSSYPFPASGSYPQPTTTLDRDQTADEDRRERQEHSLGFDRSGTPG